MNKRELLTHHGAALAVGICLLVGLYALLLGPALLAGIAWVAALAVIGVLLFTARACQHPQANPSSAVSEITCTAEVKCNRRPLISLVCLLRKPRTLDEAMLTRVALQAWDVPLGQADSSENFVAGTLPTFLIKADGHCFLVNSFAMPYFRDGSVPEELSDPNLQKRVSSHCAWISVDLLRDGRDDPSDAYRWIGRLMAALADDDCLAILCPELGRIVAYTPQCKAELCGPDPLSLLRRSTRFTVLPSAPSPALRGDQRLRHAVAQARRLWPQFVAAFEDRTSDSQQFVVRSPLIGGKGDDAAWIRVTAIENGIIYGRPSTTPTERRTLRARIEDVQDWVYSEGSGMRGGFTIEATRRATGEGTT